jgi:hypothetical protein
MLNVVEIDQVIGPRLDSRSIVVEAHTPAGQVALRLSAGAAASLGSAIATALRAAGGAELPGFLAVELPQPLPAKRPPTRLRAFLKGARKGLLATQLKQAG